MTCRTAYRSISFAGTICGIFAILGSSVCSQAQDNPNERSFPQPKAVIEKALKTLQPSMSGRLPVLDGFANPGEHPLDRYQRGYYQATPEVTSTGSGSLVRITTKVTAWYEDPVTSHGGYQLLKSNGRLEADLLDQLQEQLAKNLPEKNTAPPTAISPPKVATEAAAEPASPQKSASNFPKTDRTFSSPSRPSLPSREENAEKSSNPPSEKSLNAPQAEIESLTELVKNIAHPKNLVAVKKSGTPVVAKPSLTAKPEFLASLHDEFEMIDFNADWVHVRISGLSRGWIWRNSVEMPEGIPDSAVTPAPSATAVADLFRVSREETAPFPGDWAPLRSKNVKIISVQQEEKAKDASPRERLEYAKYLLDKNYQELSQKSQELEGIVVIFDSADGGMIAATTATLQQWRAGALTDAALWHKCFFDPPETFDSSAASGGK